MLLIFLDTETTGLDPLAHRMIEIAFQIIDSSTNKTLITYETIVQQPQEVIDNADPQSLMVNGFDQELILQGKPEPTVAEEIRQIFDSVQLSKKGGVFICQNPSFDRPFFGQLISVKEAQEKKWPYHWLDLASMYWTTHFTEISQESEISKNSIANALGIEKEKEPHRAINGVTHLLACYQKLHQSAESQVPPAPKL